MAFGHTLFIKTRKIMRLFRRTFRFAFGPDFVSNRSHKLKKSRLQHLYLFGAFVVSASLWLYYMMSRRREMPRNLLNEHTTSVGKVNIGGPFSLVDTKGRPITWASLRGRFVIIYFGFTNCPDICPDELMKMSRLVSCLDADSDVGPSKVLPVFVTIDPARDNIAAVKTYLEDFHPRIVGLTGTPALIDAACRMFRVYYSVPGLDHFTDTDYLVDHSIMTYLFAPDGTYMDHVHKEVPGHVALARFRKAILSWRPSVGLDVVAAPTLPAAPSVAALHAGAGVLSTDSMDDYDRARAAERMDPIGKGTIDYHQQLQEHASSVLREHITGSSLHQSRPEFAQAKPTPARM